MFRQIVRGFGQTVRVFGQNVREYNPKLSVIFVKNNRLSLVYIFPEKKVTYVGGQVGDQA